MCRITTYTYTQDLINKTTHFTPTSRQRIEKKKLFLLRVCVEKCLQVWERWAMNIKQETSLIEKTNSHKSECQQRGSHKAFSRLNTLRNPSQFSKKSAKEIINCSSVLRRSDAMTSSTVHRPRSGEEILIIYTEQHFPSPFIPASSTCQLLHLVQVECLSFKMRLSKASGGTGHLF